MILPTSLITFPTLTPISVFSEKQQKAMPLNLIFTFRGGAVFAYNHETHTYYTHEEITELSFPNK